MRLLVKYRGKMGLSQRAWRGPYRVSGSWTVMLFSGCRQGKEARLLRRRQLLTYRDDSCGRRIMETPT